MSDTDVIYHAGDRVVLIRDYPDDNEDLVIGCTGTVLVDCTKEYVRQNWVPIEYDNKISRGHDGGGRGKRGCCWNTDATYITPLIENKNEIQDEDIATEADLIDFLLN